MAALYCYPLCFDLCSFGAELEPEAEQRAVRALVEALSRIDEEYLRAYAGAVPTLYGSGVYYQEDDGPGPERQWWDVPAILARGYADCKGLVAWRVAELRLRGVKAEPEVIENVYPDLILFHVRVRYQDGRIEDPSKRLGM